MLRTIHATQKSRLKSIKRSARSSVQPRLQMRSNQGRRPMPASQIGSAGTIAM